jgi:prepilin-type processing-associated H-X9-DG protein
LIELLVVLGTIGILAALILAVLSRARQKVQQAECAHNVRQLGLALQEFVTDNHDYPLLANPDSRAGRYPGQLLSWVATLQHTELSTATNRISASQYLSEGVWQCPAAHRPPAYPQGRGYASYGYNWYGLSAQTDTNSLGLGGHYIWDAKDSRLPAPPVHEREVVNPSDMMAIGDGFIGGNGVVRDGVLALWRRPGVKDELGCTKRSYSRHQGRADVVFCDGHVESPALKSLFEDHGDVALVRWNRDHQPHREELQP